MSKNDLMLQYKLTDLVTATMQSYWLDKETVQERIDIALKEGATDIKVFRLTDVTEEIRNNRPSSDQEKYEHIMTVLKGKLHKGQATRQEQGYDEGICCALSKIREVYKP